MQGGSSHTGELRQRWECCVAKHAAPWTFQTAPSQPHMRTAADASMFSTGGLTGLIGVVVLSETSEILIGDVRSAAMIVIESSWMRMPEPAHMMHSTCHCGDGSTRDVCTHRAGMHAGSARDEPWGWGMACLMCAVGFGAPHPTCPS